MEGKIRAIVKRPDEPYGHVTNISNTLKNLQNIVGGHIQVVPLTGDTVIICNEDGKLQGLDKNFIMRYGETIFDIIVGAVAIVGVDGEDFGDCQMDFSFWKKLLDSWGN